MERISIAIDNAFGFRHLLFKRGIVGAQLIAAVPERRNDSYNVWAQWPGAAQKEIRIPVPTISNKHNHIVSFRCAGKPDKIMARGNNLFFACIGGRPSYIKWARAERSRRRAGGDSTRVTRDDFNAYLASSGLGAATHTTRSTASAPARRVAGTPCRRRKRHPLSPTKCVRSRSEIPRLKSFPYWVSRNGA